MAYKKQSKFILIYVIMALIILVISAIYFLARPFNNSLEKSELFINDQAFAVEIARTGQEHYLGLSNRQSLCDRCGMLFTFNEKRIRNFVMRDMYFPLDIIFIDNDTIVKIIKNLPPEKSEPYTLHSSDLPVDKVLEINAGQANRYFFKIGTKLFLKDQ